LGSDGIVNIDGERRKLSTTVTLGDGQLDADERERFCKLLPF